MIFKLFAGFVVGLMALAQEASAQAVCEATGSARCFYIDPAKGADIHTGSFASPWKTFANIQSYYQSNWRPAGWVNVQPGDFIYLRAGVHNTTRTPGDATGPSGGTRAIAYFRDWPLNAQ